MLNKGDFPYMKEKAWQDALAFKPDIVVIKLGTNDSKPHNWQYGAEFKQNLEEMVKALSPAKIYLCTPIPAFKQSWEINDSVIVNEIIPIQQEVARKYGLEIIDLHTLYANDGDKMLDDGIHPDEKGVRRIAEIVAGTIK
jgi:lysophospholipase L1-like esterase